ncbi:MAG: hypothetical protein F9K31_04060, partial [Dokdonella sp.]
MGRIRRHACLVAAAMLLGGCRAGADAQAQACIDEVAAILDQAYADLGSPPVTDRAVFEQVVRQARPRLLEFMPAHPQGTFSTSIMANDIRIWVRCDDQELSHAW